MRNRSISTFATVLTACIATPLLLSACGESHVAASQHAGTTSISAKASPTTTVSATASAVLTAYRAGWAAYDQALATANAFDPSLPTTLAQPLLQKVEAALLGDANGGVVGRGRVLLHPKVTSVSATSATIVDCTYSSSEYVDAKTGKPVPPITKPEHDGVSSTLEFQNGVWKVSQQTVTDGKCSAGA
jgi:hypothetical protein